MSDIKTFEDLQAWQACRELKLFVSRQIVPRFPNHEQFELTRQIKEAARSTTANLAEGYGRYHHLDNHKFCSNSRGSCYEVLDHLITANDDGYIDEDQLDQGRVLVNTAAKLINGYMNYLIKAAQSQRIQEIPDVEYTPINQ
ncbi:MAG: four helix bundle protein [Verrucomicrobiota bacterium]